MKQTPVKFITETTKTKVEITEIAIGDEWYTPIDFLQRVQRFFGDDSDFLDPASSPESEPYVKAKRFFFKEQDGLAQDWLGKIWLNPPYSKPLCAQFCEKFLSEYAKGNVTEALVLVNSKTETIWFQQLGEKALIRLDIRGRLRFWNPIQKNDSPRHGQTLFYFIHKSHEPKAHAKKFAKEFSDLGLMWVRLQAPESAKLAIAEMQRITRY